MLITEVISEMIRYYSGDPRRVAHFMKVYSFAKTIGEREGIDHETQEILEVAAAMHDIGIKIAEEKYNSSAGKYQEQEGPEPARKMLSALGADKKLTERVIYLIAHHHTYKNIDGMDYQILIEADFLVNAYEDGLAEQSIRTMREKIFRTKSGTEFLDNIFDLGRDH